MKNLLLSLFLLTCLCASQANVYAQQPGKRATLIGEKEQEDDPYLPNRYGNKRTSPAYSFTNKNNRLQSGSSSITTVQVNVDAGGQNILGDAANEPNIAINPLNPNQIAIGWRQFDDVASNFRQAGWAYSNNAGASWTFPGVIEPGIFRSDPVLDYDNNGNIFYNSLSHDSIGNFYCQAFNSSNGGALWGPAIQAAGGDKAWMTVDRRNSTGNGNIYTAWSPFYTSCPGFNFTLSNNNGSSYEPCSWATGEPIWGTMAVGVNGELYVCGGDAASDSFVVSIATNAASGGSSLSWQNPQKIFMDGFLSMNSINPVGLVGQANIDVDRSNGPGRGNLYVLASVGRLNFIDPADVSFVKSTDGGITWSAPVDLSLDSNNTYQWFGTMSVAPNGRIDVLWLDNRDDPSGLDSSDLRYRYSLDQGNTWSQTEILSAKFEPHIGYPNQQKMGDYFDMISVNNGVHLAWANTFNEEQDVYYSFIVPGNNVGQLEYTYENWSVYPNPAYDRFVIQGLPIGTTIEISNSIGQCIKRNVILNEEQTVNLTSLNPGMYGITVLYENGQKSYRKFLKVE